MKTAIKKVIALAAGATMVGSTIVGAMAADLASWPSPFVVKDASGKPSFDAMLVVGDTAAPADIIGITDVAISLQYQMTENKAVASTTSVSLSGDSKKIETSSNKLEFNESVDAIASSVTSSDLKLLADSEFSNEYATSTMTQTINLPAKAVMIYGVDPDDDKSAVKNYFRLTNGQPVYTYTLSFSPSVKSDHNTGGNGYLEDIRNKKLSFLGQTYTVLVADHTAQNHTTLTLMGGAVTDVIDEGETKTYTLSGKEYEVTAAFISASETKLKVNGELTDSLAETKTYKLKDGIEVGIIDILGQNLAGEVDRVEFSLGANKLMLDDANTVSSGYGGTVTVGSDELSAVKCDIVTGTDEGIASGADVKISSIKFSYNASQDIYMLPGELASAKSDTAESQVGSFLLSAFDYKFEGLQASSTEEVKLIPSGSNNYKLTFTNKANVKYDESVVGYDGTSYKLGRYSGSTWYDLVANESVLVDDEDLFCVSKNKYSRILQFKDVVPGSSAGTSCTAADCEGTVKVKDLGSGDVISISYSTLSGDLNLDGNIFKVNVSSDSNSGKLSVDMNGNGVFTDNPGACVFWTKYEANMTLSEKLALGAGSSNLPVLVFSTEEDEDNARDTVNVYFQANSDAKIDFNNSILISNNEPTKSYSLSNNVVYGLQQKEDGSNVYQDYTNYGLYIEIDRKGTGTDTQNDIKFVYPDQQVTGAFFVVGSATTASTTAGGDTTQVIHKINVGATKLASQISDVKAMNLVAVGGPCVNSVAAELMGNPANCADGFAAGKAMIKLYEASTGKVAMLVAGYSAQDTTRATKVVADNSGAKLKALAVGVKEVSVNTINEEPIVEVASQ